MKPFLAQSHTKKGIKSNLDQGLVCIIYSREERAAGLFSSSLGSSSAFIGSVTLNLSWHTLGRSWSLLPDEREACALQGAWASCILICDPAWLPAGCC